MLAPCSPSSSWLSKEPLGGGERRPGVPADLLSEVRPAGLQRVPPPFVRPSAGLFQVRLKSGKQENDSFPRRVTADSEVSHENKSNEAGGKGGNIGASPGRVSSQQSHQWKHLKNRRVSAERNPSQVSGRTITILKRLNPLKCLLE